MVTKTQIDNFLRQRKIALVGVSRNNRKFGSVIFKEMSAKGYQIFPINPNAEYINNQRCHPNLKDLPEQVDGVIIVVPPSQTEKVVQDVADLKIEHVWMQQGSESEKAIQYCKDNNISVVAGECILMFAEPVKSLHRIHRFVWKIIGKYPK